MKPVPKMRRSLFAVIRSTLLAILLMASSQAIPTVASPSSSDAANSASVQKAVNYVVRVQWRDANGKTNFLQVLTAEGNFNLDTLQRATAKVNGTDLPTTVRLQGSLQVLNSAKGRITLSLGRTVPYVAGSRKGPGGKSSRSYQQFQVGLNSTFVVTFGRPQMIQADQNGEVAILVSRQKD